MVEPAKNEQIDPALARKLDAFTVPALPAGFADRLAAAATAEPTKGEALSGAPLPPLRRAPARRWLRGGFTGLGTLVVGMISISAAAMGYLGEPIRHAVSDAPVIGAVVERVIPKAMRQSRQAVAARLAKPAAPITDAAPSAAPLEEAQPAPWPARRLTPMERRERAREIMADPEKRKAWIEAHPVAAERIMRRAELRRQRIEAGIVPPPPGPAARMDVYMPLRAMPGPGRRERMEALRERRRQRLEMRRQMQERVEEAPAPSEAQP